MKYTADAYAAMLLTMALSPNREEYAHPLTMQELARIEEKLRPNHLGMLLDMDISGLMRRLEISEEEAYRVYTLLNRTVQLSYMLEKCAEADVAVVTRFNAEYPHRMLRRMNVSAPPMFYRCGNAELLEAPMLAILGISGIKTGTDAREAVDTLVREGTRFGYTILTGGEPGISRAALQAVRTYGGTLVEILAGDFSARMKEADVAELLEQDRAALVSLEHPEAMPTVSHAIARSRVIFALSEAAFIFNTDGKRGEIEALRTRLCDWIYAWTNYPANQSLVPRGAIPITDIPNIDMEALSRHWRSSRSEQMDIYQMLDQLK